MLSRSEKSCFASSRSFARKLPVALALGAGLFAGEARAIVTISGTNPSSNTLGNVVNNNAYFPAAPTGALPGGFFYGADGTTPPKQLDLSSGTSTSNDPAQAMLFTINSSLTGISVPAGNQLLLMAFSSGGGTSGSFVVPVAWANASIGIGGNGSLSKCVQNGQVITPCTLGYTANNIFYAYAIDLYNGDTSPPPQIPTPLGNYQIGIYPFDVCNGYPTGGAPTFCSGGKPETTPGATGQMTLTFALVMVSDTNTTFFPSNPAGGNVTTIPLGTPSLTMPGNGTGTPPAGGAITIDSQAVTVYFQTEPSQMNCFPANTVNGGAADGSPPSAPGPYTPGDGQIFVNLGQISLNTSANGTVAPPGSLIAVANEADGPTVSGSGAFTGSTPPAQPNLTSASQIGTFAVNDILSGIGVNFFPGSALQPVPNFQNSDQTTSHFYNVQLLLRDVTGYVAYAPSGGCYLPGGSSTDFVRTAAINGALTKSNCFIATAAFRSADEAPVLMLRHFRDTVLLHSKLGREFVHLYYHFSPPAAYWLVDHPAFRIPVLLALVPVQVIAWLCLRPFLFGILAVLSAFVLLAALALSRGHFSGRKRGGAI